MDVVSLSQLIPIPIFFPRKVFKPGKSAVPLHLASSWNCSPTSTEFSLEYMQNMTSLCDIHILLPLDETVSNLQFDPPARW